jgi:hypothetical protein
MSELVVSDLLSPDRLVLSLTIKDTNRLLLVLDLARDALVRCEVDPSEIDTPFRVTRLQAGEAVDDLYERIKCEIADQKLGRQDQS